MGTGHPSAHYIPEERQTIRYLRKWYSAYGKVVAKDFQASPTLEWFGKPHGSGDRRLKPSAVSISAWWAKLKVWIGDLIQRPGRAGAC